MSTDLRSLDPPPRPRCGGVWDYVSPSRLGCWLGCPLRWKLAYLDGIRTPTSPALLLGRRCHAGLADHYQHRMGGVPLGPGEVLHRLDAGWEQAVADENMTFESPAQEAALRRQAVDLVGAYLAAVPADEPRPLAVEAAMEVPLVDPRTGEDLGIPLLGILDLVLDTEEGPVVVDFKTAARAGAPLEIAHEVPLTSHSYLVRRTTCREEAGLEIRSLIKTRQPKVEVHRYPPRTDAHFGRLFAVVREYLDALDTGRFPFRPGWGCATCEWRETHCRQGSG